MGYELIALGNVPKAHQRIGSITSVGMNVLIQCMGEAGCLDEDSSPPPYVKTCTRSDESEHEFFRRLQDLSVPFRSFVSKKRGKVPARKFKYNEGWLFSASEAGIIGDAMKRWLKGKRKLPDYVDDPDLVRGFTAFCLACAKSHGFRVD